MYNYAGHPWRTQERLKQIVDSQYKPTPAGLSGNDELGQMMAWMFFTGLGFYPVAPGSNQYVIGRPFVERPVLNVQGGKHFTVHSHNMSAAHPPVGRVLMNSNPRPKSNVIAR